MKMPKLSTGFKFGVSRPQKVGEMSSNTHMATSANGQPICGSTGIAKQLHFDQPHSLDNVRQAKGSRRVAELDSLRGLAALLIVIYHLRSTLIPWGWAAVDLFFVLSGYLITAIIIKHGNTHQFLRNFYVRRGLRVWPIYYLAILLMGLASPYVFAPTDWKGLPFLMTFTQNIEYYWMGVPKLFSPYLGHFWTLAIEEQFYLVWPAIILIAGRKHVLSLSLLCLAISIWSRTRGINPVVMVPRADGLALGGLLAAILARHPVQGPHRRQLIGLFGLTAFLSMIPLSVYGVFKNPNVWVAISQQPVVSILAFSTFWFGIVGLVVCQCGQPAIAILRIKPLQKLGIISYGLYLYHYPIIEITNQIAIFTWKFTERPIWMDLIIMPVCFGVAWLSWIYIERPILGLKDRFNYGTAQKRRLKIQQAEAKPVTTLR